MSSMTASQQAALAARGNVLVVAGAGTGKTHTLVERCCALLLDEGCSLDEILMVTFTDASAAEMRKRIRARLAEKASEAAGGRGAAWLEEQLALLDTAHISTLHSFCLRLVREHFHDERLRLDPEFVVLTEEQVHQLRNNTLDALLEANYGGDSEEARAFRAFVTEQVAGMESKAQDLIWKLHRYAQSLANPEAWFENQLELFSQAEPARWRQWLRIGFAEWKTQWVADLQVFSGTPNVADCLSALKAVKVDASLEEISEALGKIRETREGNWPRGTVGKVRDKLKEFFTDAAFLESLLPTANGADPLKEDWEWSRGQMGALLRLAREFGETFDTAKREAGGVDFADLEQFALRLLWDEQAKGPTSLAREWQARLKFVFVDEYQDINEAQDTILRALSREGAEANRFLVGDVKQSIYRFRLADPKIFQAYKQRWERKVENGRTIALSDNFRSREALLDFINSFFELFMRSEVGGVTYDAEARLRFGAPEAREHLGRGTSASPHVEIHLLTKTKEDGVGQDEDGDGGAFDLAEMDSTEKEARLVALQLKKLRREKMPVWDEDAEVFRPAEWRDMVVLMRSPRNKAEIYAREFNRAGVPLQVRRGSFYGATEVSDLLSLLQLLDNPMQDLPLLAVLRSPLVGLSVDELAMIRAAQHEDRFWTAVLKFAAMRPRFEGEAGAIAMGAQPKVRAFLKSFEKWRRQARRGALSNCVRTILDETGYESLVLAQERGEERLANVNRLLRLMRQFDPYQRQGLMRFLRFVEAQRDAEAEEEPASAAGEDAVRLLSIHQSKGLEFPVVAVADFGKRFNLGDLKEDILLDGEFGLCPKIAPPGINGLYPSLPYWLARRRQKRELLGEELRLLYVAMTRARDRLLLVGSVAAKQFETRWKQDAEINATSLLRAGTYADWLGAWFAKKCEAAAGQTTGEARDCRWFVHDDASLREDEDGVEAAKEKAVVRLSRAEAERLRKKLEAKYPFGAATTKSAKTSVSTLRRRAMELMEQEETVEMFRPRARARAKGAAENSAAEIGTAHHRFLERVDFKKLSTLDELRAEAEQMVGEGILSESELVSLNFDSLLRFWRSDFGKKIQASAAHVKRELAFTARFSPAELPREANDGLAAELHGEFVIVQGVADVAVILPKEIWLLDYKTDRVENDEVKERGRFYEPQLNLYARALERIYGRPVTDRRLHFLSCGVTVPIT